MQEQKPLVPYALGKYREVFYTHTQRWLKMFAAKQLRVHLPVLTTKQNQELEVQARQMQDFAMKTALESFEVMLDKQGMLGKLQIMDYLQFRSQSRDQLKEEPTEEFDEEEEFVAQLSAALAERYSRLFQESNSDGALLMNTYQATI